jgi:hypothetical protein
MLLITFLLDRGIRLSEWRKYEAEVAQLTRVTAGTTFNTSIHAKTEKQAQAIVTQLSHDDVVELVANEWGKIEGVLRMAISQKCNEANVSGNVRKNIQRLDRRLNGKLLRAKEEFVIKTRTRVEGPNGVRYVERGISRSEVGARQKYQLLK